MITDEQLFVAYEQGFNDELDGNNAKTKFNSCAEKYAYNVGVLDAWAGDDVTSIRNESKEEIIYRLKNAE